MPLNRISQAELEIYEAEYFGSRIANLNIQYHEKVNLIGDQEYGKPDIFGEEDCSLRECVNPS